MDSSDRSVGFVSSSNLRGIGIVVDENGRQYHVRGALAGEKIEYHRLRRKWRGRRIGHLNHITEPSSTRTSVLCDYFEKCGGCALQHVFYSDQVTMKEQKLYEIFSELGECESWKKLPSLTAAPWHYRRKARLSVKWVEKKGGLIIGFREPDSSFVTGVSTCHVVVKHVADILLPLRNVLAQMSCRDCIPQIEVVAADNALNLILRHLAPLSSQDLSLLTKFANKYDCQLFSQRGGLGSISSISPTHPLIPEYKLPNFNLTYNAGLTDFVQINKAVNELMVTHSIESLELKADDIMLDLFSGIGNFSLPIAQSIKEVYALEGDASSVQSARQNAINNNISNAHFHCVDLFNASDISLWIKKNSGVKINCILIDPPRSGAELVVEHMVSHFQASKIMYVSCNPDSLARDAKNLKRKGYQLQSLQMVDMFPHTHHIEVMGLFTLEKT